MKKYKIILVENDPDEQFFMKKGFDETDLFEVIAMVKNGDTLLEWLEQNPAIMPDLILSDLNMPGKNGIEIIHDLKNDEVYKNVPVIITSTSSTQSIMNQCLEKGAASYFVKPDTFVNYAPYVKQLYTFIEDKKLVGR